MSESHPKLLLEIRELTTNEIVEALSREQIDVGLLALPIEGANLQTISLFSEPFYLFVHRDHDLAKRKVVDVADIDGKELWLLEEGHCFRDQVLRVCKLRGRRPSGLPMSNLKADLSKL